MRRLTCLVCGDKVEAKRLSHCHLLRDEHMAEKHDMYPIRTVGGIVYKKRSERSVAVLGRKPYTDMGGMLALIAGVR